MEGVPRLYMIGLPIKRCPLDADEPDFAAAINHHIQKTYGRDVGAYGSDVHTVRSLRRNALQCLDFNQRKQPDESTTIAPLKRYYAQLARLTDKFPGLLQGSAKEATTQQQDGDGGPAPTLTFAWKRGLGGGGGGGKKRRKTQPIVDYGDIAYEMRCVLYNIGAAHARLAAAQDRSPPLGGPSTTVSSDDGESESAATDTALKVACTHLQCAAWAFQQLLGGSQHDTSASSKQQQHLLRLQQPPVTGRAVLEFAYAVTLGQAQECILEKSMTDGRKSLIVAKVSAMICEYFAGATAAVRRAERDLQLDRQQRIVGAAVGAARLEKWRLYAEFKCRYYGAVTALFQGQHAHDQLRQMGIRVTYYRRAVNLLLRATQTSEDLATAKNNNDDDDCSDSEDDYYHYYTINGELVTEKELEMRRDTLTFAMDVAGAKYTSSKSENELIYHEPVTSTISDDDDAECFVTGANSTTTSSSPLDRVKGAALVKPIGFASDDPELLTVMMADSSNGSTSTTLLFKDLVPAAARHRAAAYRAKRRATDAAVRAECRAADERLAIFVEALQLECLEVYSNCVDGVDIDEEDDENNAAAELPQKLINYCAAYQALLMEHQDEDQEHSAADQLANDMDRLGAAIQAVDNMLDDIDRHLKAEEQADAEYRRTTGRAYDHGVGRMRELRLEAQRYRSAHGGPARDSWEGLTRATSHLQLLRLSPRELAAKLPRARLTRASVATRVVEVASQSADSVATTDKKDDNSVSADDDGYDHNDSPLAIEQKLKEESTARMDRLVHVVGKMREMRDQRRMLIGRLREEMEKEDAEDAQSGQLPAQDDVDLLRELGNGRVSAADAASAKRRLDARYGELLNLIERNLSAQPAIVDAVRAAYARAAPERRAYANAVRERRTAITQLFDAYESVVQARSVGEDGENEDEVDEDVTNRHPHAVLAARCRRGLDFYHRLRGNVAKLLQRVKGTCQVQTEQRDQMIRQHQLSQMQSDSDSDDNDDNGGDSVDQRLNAFMASTTTDDPNTDAALDNLIAAFDLQDLDHLEDADAADSMKGGGVEGGYNRVTSTSSLPGLWGDLGRRRRLSPLGSEHQQQQMPYSYQQYHQQQQQQQQQQKLPTLPSLPSQSAWSGVASADYAKFYAEQKAAAAAAATTKYGYVDPVAAALQQRQLLMQQQQHHQQQLQQQQRVTSFPTVAAYNDVGRCATTAAVVNTITTLTSPSAYSYYNNVQQPRHLPPVADPAMLQSPTSSSVTNHTSLLPSVSAYNAADQKTSAYDGNVFTNSTVVSTAPQPQPLQQYSAGGFQQQQPTPVTPALASQQQQQQLQLYQQQQQQQQQFQLQQQQQLLQQYRQQYVQQPAMGGGLGALPSALPSPISTATALGGLSGSTASSAMSGITSKFFPQLQLQDDQPPKLYQPQQHQSQLSAAVVPGLFYQQQQMAQQLYQPQQQQQQQQQQISQLHQTHPQTGQATAASQLYHQPQHVATSQPYQPSQHHQQVAPNLYQQPQQLQAPTVNANSNAYYQQLQPQQTTAIPQQQQQQQQTSQLYQTPPQQPQPTTTSVPATLVTGQHGYYYQPTTAYNQYQLQQQYTSAAVPADPLPNLLDDDLLQLPVTGSAPALMQPEKVGSAVAVVTTTAATSGITS